MSAWRTIATIEAYEVRVTVTWDGVVVQELDDDEINEESRYSSLREAVLDRPDIFESDLRVDGIEPDSLARLFGEWDVPIGQLLANDRAYDRRGDWFCPSEGHNESGYVEVASRISSRYGGDIGPCSTLGGIEIGHVGDFWLTHVYEEGWEPVGWFESFDEGVRAAAAASGAFAVTDDGVVVPWPSSEEDAVWWHGDVYVEGVDGIAPVATRRKRKPRSTASLLPVRVRWSFRARTHKLLRGKVFVDEATWTVAELDGTPDDEVAVGDADDRDTAFVIIRDEPDLAVPLWLTLTRLAKAARTWGSDEFGEPASDLRAPPAIAEFADGARCYGVAVDPVIAADTAAAFGQSCWFSITDGHLVARWHDGDPLIAAPCEVAPCDAPLEGDALWDDGRFGGGADPLDAFAQVFASQEVLDA